MKNFIYKNPTKVIFGKGEVHALAKEISIFGNSVLLVYGGKSIIKNGIYEIITNDLKNANIKYYDLPNVTAHITDIYRGIKLVKENNIDVVVALGGGSCIDSAKSIALGASGDGDISDYLTGKADYHDVEVMPIGSVVTVAASGSEVDGNSEIYDRENNFGGRGEWHGEAATLFPKFTILDPELTFSVPAKLTAYNGACTISQGMEQYINDEEATPIQDGFLETIFATSINSLKVLKENLQDYDARANMMWASALVCNRILGRGKNCTWQIGRLAHIIMENHDVSYVESTAIIFPKYLRAVAKEQSKIIAQFAKNVLKIDAKSNDYETALAAADWMQEFFSDLGIATTYGELGINEKIENLSGMIDIVVDETGLSSEQVREIIESSLQGGDY